MAGSPRILVHVETSRQFDRGILLGINTYSRQRGPWEFYRILTGVRKSPRSVIDWKPDGIIARDSCVSEEILASGVPIILLIHGTGRIAKLPYVCTSSDTIGKMAADHFLHRGYSRFAYCGRSPSVEWAKSRGIAFARKVQQAGYKTQFYQYPESKELQSWQNEQLRIIDWLKSLPKPTALLACNDDRALQVSDACQSAGIKIPEQVAVLGVDNDPLVCQLANPPSSSIALNSKMAGYEAADLMYRLINGERMNSQSIAVKPTHIETRTSTDITTAPDPALAIALKYINRHHQEQMRIENIAGVAAISRRTLERKFRRFLGRSIHAQIRKVRIENSQQALAKTDEPISKIAIEFGYSNSKHFSRNFQQVTGTTPQNFRKEILARSSPVAALY